MKILLADIETAPTTAFVWGLWDENIPVQRIIKPGYTLCYSAKWYGEDGIMFDSIHNSSPKTMTKNLHKLLNEADAVVGYNSKKFDHPTINKDFVLHGLPPPSPYAVIDLYPVVKRNFRFPSAKLEFVAKALGIGEKVKTRGFDLWIDCIAGDEKAWKEMETYNKQDTLLLESLYNILKPWIHNHPNVALYNGVERPVCPTCGSKRLQSRGYRYSKVHTYRRYQCLDCRSWSSSRTAEKIDRKHVLVAV